LCLFFVSNRSFEAKHDLSIERSMRLACGLLQLPPQVDREAERKAHSGITATVFHIEIISQRYHLCGPMDGDSGLIP
jgi:hypothetical protein